MKRSSGLAGVGRINRSSGLARVGEYGVGQPSRCQQITWADRRNAAMIPQLIRELACFVAAGILCVFPLAELPPLVHEGPVISAARDNSLPIIAIVTPRVEFQLIKASRRKRREDWDAVQPAWVILWLMIFVFLYLYHYDRSHTITVNLTGISL